jgi:hypothetical protein
MFSRRASTLISKEKENEERSFGCGRICIRAMELVESQRADPPSPVAGLMRGFKNVIVVAENSDRILVLSGVARVS